MSGSDDDDASHRDQTAGRARWMRVRELFDAALDVEPSQREAWLAAECRDDTDLLGAVGALLAADATAGPALLCQADGPPGAHGATFLARPAAASNLCGRRVGGFTLLRLIGAGGMGAVYEAEQDWPRRRVAWKTLRVPFPTARARRRFEDEAEILARLRHPGIAVLLEAGTWNGTDTDAASPDPTAAMPWLAMELVDEPLPIDRYVREHALDVTAIVELVRTVCAAVHFAHQRGVIHRDLKPGNVLVDQSGAPKVIDFGIARVADDAFEERRTLTGELLGTPAYMSPERLAEGAAAADAGSDVWSLGVILYELLAGQPPFAIAGLTPVGAVEVLRRDDPRPPSAVAERLAVPAELDWIVRKAMSREPERRYASASELAADLERFTRDEPLAAGPPGTAYRLCKFMRRHRRPLAAAALLLLSLVAGTIVALAGWRRAVAAERVAEERRQQVERERATLAQVNRVQQKILSATYSHTKGRDVRLADLLDAAIAEFDAARVGDPEVEAGLRNAVGIGYLGLGLVAEAERQFRRGSEVLREHGRAAGSLAATLRCNVGIVHINAGRLDDAERELRHALDVYVATWGDSHEQTGIVHSNLADVLFKRGRAAVSLPHAEAAWRIFVQRHGEFTPEAVTARGRIGLALDALGRTAEADVAFADVRRGVERLGEHPAALAARGSLATRLMERGRLAEALVELEQLVVARERVFGPAHSQTMVALTNLATAHQRGGDLAAAEGVLRRVVETRERSGQADSFDGLAARQNLAFVLRRLGRCAEGLAAVEALRADAARVLPAGHWLVGVTTKEHGCYLRDLDRAAEAEPLLLEAASTLERAMGAGDGRTQRAWQDLVEFYERQGRAEDAAKWAARLNAKGG